MWNNDFEDFSDIKVNDIIETYEITEKARKT